MTGDELLVMALQAAVPLLIVEMADLTGEARAVIARAAADPVAEHGDDLLYGGRHCAATFGAVARGIAAAAYAPGGITFAGAHWCVDHDACNRAEEAAATCR